MEYSFAKGPEVVHVEQHTKNQRLQEAAATSSLMSKLKRVRPAVMLRAWFRRVSLLNLLCMFLVVTVLLTAYMHGLIEVDSSRVVINIASGVGGRGDVGGGDESSGSRDSRLGRDFELGESEFYQSDSSFIRNRKIQERHDRLDNRRFNAEPKTEKKTTATKRPTNDFSLDKNITNFFLVIDRSRQIILSRLDEHEIQELLELKNAMFIAASLDNERTENPSNDELDRVPGAVGDQQQRADNNDPSLPMTRSHKVNMSDAGNFEPPLPPKNPEIDPAGLAFSPISRELLIKFLKLEKFRLQKLKTIKSVRELLEEFIRQSDLDRDELPEIWSKYFVYINEIQLYNNSKVVDELLARLSAAPVTSCFEKEKGTQIKLLLNLEDGTDVLVKPMKVPRDYETPPDHFYFVDFERHHAEIAAFHVDRLLGFNRVPPTVGRVFNMTTDLWEKSEDELAKTFFYSPAGNVCFTGHCSYYCDTTHAICGKPRDKMEGSVQLMLPSKPIVKWQVFNHPYRRTYTKRKKALWEVDETYCVSKILQDVEFTSKVILDLMDMAVFDFLTGNMDRHHYEKMIALGNDTFMLHLDNGRSFGKAYHDEMSILAPLRQCCLLRYSTFERLRHLYMHKFSTLLDASLRADPLYPILTEAHLASIDRRLALIFYQLIECTKRFKTFQVIVDDGY